MNLRSVLSAALTIGAVLLTAMPSASADPVCAGADVVVLGTSRGPGTVCTDRYPFVTHCTYPGAGVRPYVGAQAELCVPWV